MKKIIFLLTVILISVSVSFSQNTDGSVTFTVTTVSEGGQYAPKNIVAIWIKNSSGTFIRSMKVMAATRIQYLYQWKASSNLNKTDAITGATLTSHQTHTITWNCKDLSGNIVPDGDYQFWIEYTDKDAQGPYTNYTFAKGTSPVSTNFTNQTYFVNASINYTPNTTGIISPKQINANVYRESNTNTNTYIFEIPTAKAENVLFRIFNISGQVVHETQKYSDNGEIRRLIWNKPNSLNGIYIYQIESGDKIFSGKFH
ncbi:hypothetical protein CYCD_02940 [Tenuifilaceae bacterium CYCD]|nr:hypothetical protein CYCD_02940 [Tenuifilaceae bacterium CYCD]